MLFILLQTDLGDPPNFLCPLAPTSAPTHPPTFAPTPTGFMRTQEPTETPTEALTEAPTEVRCPPLPKGKKLPGKNWIFYPVNYCIRFPSDRKTLYSQEKEKEKERE